MSFIRKFKLEELCLHVIIKNLEKFIYSQNVPQIHIDFLLRCYSEDIYKKLGSIRHSEDYILWFLNPCSKKTYLRTISEKILTRLRIVGSTISSLSLRNSDAREDTINSIVCYIPQVTDLDLSSTQCTDKTMLCIQRMCSNLTTLNLYQCENVGDNGMKNLCGGNLSLRNLNLIATAVEFDGICDILMKMPLIECLKHCDMDFLHGLFMDIKRFSRTAEQMNQFNLTELIYEGGIDDPLEVLSLWTTMCPNVKKVHIKFTTTNKVLQICTKFKNLEDLKIEYSNFDSDDERWFPFMYSTYTDPEVDSDDDYWFPGEYPEDVLAPFAINADTLRTLSLSNVTISIESLMQCYKNVTNMKLENVTFIEFAEENIKVEENKLNALYINSSPLENSATCRALLHLLSVSKNVTDLHLESMIEMPPKMFDIILNSMKNLLYVNLVYMHTEHSILIRFFEIPSLKVFNTGIYFDSPSSVCKQYLTQIQPCTLSWQYLDECSDDEIESDDESENSENSFDFCHFK